MGHLMSENSYFGHWVWVVVESKQHWAKTENGCYCSPLYLWRCRTSMLSVESTGGWGWNRATSQISILKVPRKKKITVHKVMSPNMRKCWEWAAVDYETGLLTNKQIFELHQHKWSLHAFISSVWWSWTTGKRWHHTMMFLSGKLKKVRNWGKFF